MAAALLPHAMNDTRVTEWAAHMRRGDFAAAWAVSDGALHDPPREREAERPRHQQRVWDGTPLAGRRVLVRCYHGLGDTLQFARYLPRVSALAAELAVWAQPPLILLSTLPGAGRLLPLHDGTPDVPRDVDVEIMELPHVFRNELDTLPSAVPYLHVAPAPRPAPRDRLAVGLAWAAGEWDARRSVPRTPPPARHGARRTALPAPARRRARASSGWALAPWPGAMTPSPPPV